MKKIIVALFMLVLLSMNYIGYTQDENYRITKKDQSFFESIPKLTFNDISVNQRSQTLPISLNNAEQKFFRDVFMQSGPSCGQASSIGYILTYELNRIRNVSADTSMNLYPSHFSWNFLNRSSGVAGGGNGSIGASVFDSWDITRKFGCPNLDDFNGMTGAGINNYDGVDHWMSGYEKYYNAMHNRIKGFYAIDVSSEEGLLTLKHWLNNHLNGEETGGIASILISSTDIQTAHFAEGTPEEGHYVVTSWGQWVGHQITLLGYNDSVRFDYNNDGLYTNNIDINEDGMVNMKDWEIGAYIIANSWGVSWGEGGFAYMMYRVGAYEGYEGGLWKNSAFVIDVKETTTPELTLKAKIKHEDRSMLKIYAGISNNIESDQPEYVIDFPIFSYSGTPVNMQGGTNEEDQTLELGLDISPLLSEAMQGGQIKIFLIVEENDPYNMGNGEVVEFSVIDYNNNETEYICTEKNVPINNNTNTLFDVVLQPEFEKLKIDNQLLEPMQIGQEFSTQLNASGGKEPYNWDLLWNYSFNIKNEKYIAGNETQLYYHYSTEGYFTEISLDFDFPFYGENKRNLKIHHNGIITFDDVTYKYTYALSPEVLLKKTQCIAPLFYIYTGMPDPNTRIETVYEGNEDFAVIRWKDLENIDPNIKVGDFTVKLESNGNISFYYDNISAGNSQYLLSGISNGDNVSHHLFNGMYAQTDQNFLKYEYVPSKSINDLEISDNGLITGNISEECTDGELVVKVSDVNLRSIVKSFPISTNGIIINNLYNQSEEKIVHYGESIHVQTTITNQSGNNLQNIIVTLSDNSSFISLNNNSFAIDDIPAGQSFVLDNALSFEVDASVPNNHLFKINYLINANEEYLLKQDQIVAYSPLFGFEGVSLVGDDNQIPDPGETVNMEISLTNYGVSTEDVIVKLISHHPDIEILDPTSINFGSINSSFQKVSKNFKAKIPYAFEVANLHTFELEVSTLNGQMKQYFEFDLRIGREDVVIINLDPSLSSIGPLESAFDSLNVNYQTYNQWPTEPLQKYHLAFILTGPMISPGSLNNQNLIEIEDYLNAHGSVYLEGGRVWKTVNESGFPTLFGIHVAQLSASFTFDTIRGVDGTIGHNYNFFFDLPTVNQGNYNFFNLLPIQNGEVFMKNVSNDVGVSVSNTTEKYKTIGSGTTIGGYNDIGNGDIKSLVASYLRYFKLKTFEVGIEEFPDLSENIVKVFPNPFINETTFSFNLRSKSNVSVQIFDLNGSLIKTLINTDLNAGLHNIFWNKTGDNGTNVKPGIYLYRSIINNTLHTGRLISIN